MELEQRGRVRRSHARSNWKQEDLDACDRQAVWSACLPDGSRVRRESHARFCERPVVKFRRPTQPHICARSRKGKFTVHVKTIRKRLRRGLLAIAAWCQEHRHDAVSEQQKTLNAKLRGHYQYYGRPTNYRCLWLFYRKVRRIWREWLSRRTRGRWLTWERYAAILRQHPLLQPRITHSWAGAGSTA